MSLDFSDMFRQTNREMTKSLAVNRKLNDIIDENTPPVVSSTLLKNDENVDDKAYITTSLKGLNYIISDPNCLSPDVLTVLKGLLLERNHLQTQNCSLMDETSKLQHSIISLQKDKERDNNTIQSTKGELNLLHNRMNATANEQRELRAHWMSEKNELEGRIFQSQSLLTQTQGTLRKKDKDYEKLQNQLSKIVKESNRGNKASIVVSKPLVKNLTQQNKNGTIKDAEIVAAQSTICLLENGNTILKKSVDELSRSLLDMKEQFKATIKEIDMQRDHDESIINDLIAKLELATTTAAVNVHISTPDKKSSDEKEETKSPMGLIARKFIEGTPGARNISFIVEQANTEVKRLRDRANRIERGDKYEDIHNKLIEAMLVIQEQDRLIHDALLGRLPGMTTIATDINSESCKSNQWDDEDQAGDDEPVVAITSNDATISSRSPLSPMHLDESQFPIASPATMEVVKGWFKAIPK